MVAIPLQTLAADALGDINWSLISTAGSEGLADAVVSDVQHDSRKVESGSLFCAVAGETFDGHDYVASAATQGAAAALVERQVNTAIAQILVPDVRAAMPLLAAEVHGQPSHEIAVVGVTGTNGKTTITHMVASIAKAAGLGTVTIGTLTGERTTPEGPELQRRLRAAVDDECGLVAMEVSSHALKQSRVDGTRFAVSVFTNLTPDHLDYHGSMQAYFDAKARLFDSRSEQTVIVADDVWGEQLARLRTDAVVLTSAQAREAIVERTPTETTFVWDGHSITLPLVGDFNVLNAMCAAACGQLLGLRASAITSGLAELDAIPGRMERVAGLPVGAPAVYIDYSHTPDSLGHALRALRAIASEGEPTTAGTAAMPRVLVAFGCGGDRDRSKRPLMGAAAADSADVVIVTSDNPRTEDPESIISAILGGIESTDTEVLVEPDRTMAIALAMKTATAEDLVLIAGRGHETMQVIGTEQIPFADLAKVREYWGLSA